MSIIRRIVDMRSMILIQRLPTLESSRALSAAAQSALNNEDQQDHDLVEGKPFETIPSLSVFQTLRRFSPGGKYYNFTINDLHKSIKSEFGDIMKIPGMLGKPPIVMTYDPKNFETVFRNDGQYPERNALHTLDYYRKNVRPEIYAEYGGLINEQGERWQKFRTLVNPIVAKPQTIKLYVPQVDEIVRDFIKVIEAKRDENDEVPANFSDYVCLWSMESITCITLNRRLGLFDENNRNEDADKLISLIRKFMEESVAFEVKPSIWRFYHTKAFKSLLNTYHQMYEIALKLVNESTELLKNEPEKPENEKSILEKLSKINIDVAVIMSADSVMAGVDTIVAAFFGILYCLATNPEKQQKLRDEVLKILLNSSDALTAEKMRNLPYMRAVIKEGMRLYPPGTGIIRRLNKEVVLSGYKVPIGTDVAMMVLFTSNDEKYHARPKEFIPERWMKDNTDPQCPHAKDTNPFSYMPFGFGARMCLGRRIAELELEVIMMRIVRDFKVEWNYGPMKIKSMLLNIPEGDLKFKFTKLSDS